MPNRMPPVHPGEILKGELHEIELSANALASALAVPASRITMILRGNRDITADAALRLARFFGTSAQFRLNLQQSYDLKIAERRSGKKITGAVKPRAA